MSVHPADLIARLGANEDVSDLDIGQTLALAETEVARLLTRATGLGCDVSVLPEDVRDEGVLRCAVNLYNRAQAPQGFVMQVADDVGAGAQTPLRVARDPLTDVRPLFAPFGVSVVWGFA